MVDGSPTPSPESTPTATSARAGSGDGTSFVIYDDGVVNVGGSPAWRNNNPGNIRAGDFADQHGAIGTDGGFAVFPTPETGQQALGSLLQSPTYQSQTVGDAISSYAPPSENDTQAYIDNVSGETGLSPDTPMSSLTSDQLDSLSHAIQRQEGSIPGDTYAVDDPDLPDAVKDALPPNEQTPESGGQASNDSPDEAHDNDHAPGETGQSGALPGNLTPPETNDHKSDHARETGEDQGKPRDDGPNESGNIGFHH
jgi:hypothetical protein